MRRDQRVSICVDDETPPYAYMMIEGMATFSADSETLLYWAICIGGRYMGEDLAEAYGRRNGVPGELVVRVTPARVVFEADIASYGGLMAYAYWVIAGLWLLWAAYWMASARRTKQSAQAEATPSRLMHLALLTAAFALLALPAFEIGFLQWRLLLSRVVAFVTGVVLEALGLGFSVWARVHLGQYWSGTIDIKPEHQLISGGPYAFVRHPIYTGLVLAFLGTALAEDEISGLHWHWSSLRIPARSGSRKGGLSATWARNIAPINAS